MVVSGCQINLAIATEIAGNQPERSLAHNEILVSGESPVFIGEKD